MVVHKVVVNTAQNVQRKAKLFTVKENFAHLRVYIYIMFPFVATRLIHRRVKHEDRLFSSTDEFIAKAVARQRLCKSF